MRGVYALDDCHGSPNMPHTRIGIPESAWSLCPSGPVSRIVRVFGARESVDSTRLRRKRSYMIMGRSLQHDLPAPVGGAPALYPARHL